LYNFGQFYPEQSFNPEQTNQYFKFWWYFLATCHFYITLMVLGKFSEVFKNMGRNKDNIKIKKE
jgi:hypothetical protein